MRRISEQLVADPFAVTTSIAHFELLNARAVALSSSQPAIVREPLAYWAATFLFDFGLLAAGLFNRLLRRSWLSSGRLALMPSRTVTWTMP